MTAPASSRPRRQDAAFTMIEVVVALVLASLVLGMLVTALINVMGSSDRTTQEVKAQKAATAAVEQLTSDLQAARAPDREPYRYGSPERLRGYIRTPDAPSNKSLRIDDVRLAQPNSVRFWADVATNPGVECVEWYMAGDGSLRRTVRATPLCNGSGTPLQETIVMPPRSARAVAGGVNPFKYRKLRNDNQSPSGEFLAYTCTSYTEDSAGTDKDRNRITAVNLDLRAFVSKRDTRGEQELQSTVAIASRGAYEYRYALGCAA